MARRGTLALQRGTSRTGDARRIEEEEERIAVGARHAEVDVVGQPVARRTGGPGPGHVEPETERVQAAMRSSRSATRRADSLSRPATEDSTATARARIAGTSRVPDRTCRPGRHRSCGTRTASRAREGRRPRWDRRACARTATSGQDRRPEIDGDVTDRLHCVGVDRYAVPWATAVSSATGWIVPIRCWPTVMMSATSEVSLIAARRASVVTTPAGRARRRRPGPLSGEEFDRIEDGVVLDAADHDPRRAGRRRGVRHTFP